MSKLLYDIIKVTIGTVDSLACITVTPDMISTVHHYFSNYIIIGKVFRDNRTDNR